MELTGHDIVLPYGRDEWSAVDGCRGCDHRINRLDEVGMNKIPVRTRDDIRKQWTRPLDVDLVPSHMWDLQGGIRDKPLHLAGNDIESLVRTELLTFRKQQLKPQADAQKGLARLNR